MRSRSARVAVAVIVGTLLSLTLFQSAESPDAGQDRGGRVLVVEDQDLVRRTVESMRASLGYFVTIAASGGEARECIAAGTFDLLVSDIVLPDTTGVELAHEFRREKPELAVLLMSGYAEAAVRKRAAGLGFLQKPFRLDDLAREVTAALDEGSGSSSG